MREQKLTPEQYRRANRVLMLVLSIVYVIFVVVEANNFVTDKSNARILRMVLYGCALLSVNVFVRMNMNKKISMVFMSTEVLLMYMLLVLGNGTAAMVIVFPIILVFMIYLNARVIAIGTVSSFIICLIRAIMYKNQGDVVSFRESGIVMMGLIICIYGSWRAINLLIAFSQEDKKVIQDEMEHQAQIAQTVSKIVENLNDKFTKVVQELNEISMSMGNADNAMDNIAQSSESTAEAVSQQADMTGKIQTRLENSNAAAESAGKTTGSLKSTINTGKELAGELHNQSMLVDKNTTKISQTVEELVSNVEKVSSITESILQISSQTNLLALNASIEAARAGEAGKGFAVVADEIRELAEQTKMSTEKITDIINQLTAVTQETKMGINESADSINVQREKVQQVNESFAEMESGIVELYSSVKNMTGEINEVYQANKAIVDSISMLSASSEEVSAGAQTGKETMNSVYKSLKNFSDMIEETFEQLKELKAAVEN